MIGSYQIFSILSFRHDIYASYVFSPLTLPQLTPLTTQITPHGQLVVNAHKDTNATTSILLVKYDAQYSLSPKMLYKLENGVLIDYFLHETTYLKFTFVVKLCFCYVL